MAAEENIIVAIVLGSSQITAVAGSKQPDGAIRVLAYAQEPSRTFIRKGRINNVNKMKQCIINMKEKLEKTLKKTINLTYVGIGGMGMHTVANTVVRHFDEKKVISKDLVDDMLKDNQSTATPDREIFEVVPQEFKIGTQTQIDPVGIPTECVEGRYLNIVANGTIAEDIESCFKAAGLRTAGTPISVLSLSNVILSESEKRSGCVFVDMGSETTSVAIYKNNLLRHFAVIPLGSANVNRDIASLQIEDNEAEALKMQFGSALYEEALEEKSPIKLKDGRSIKFEDFAGLVEARMEEIILNIKHQIELSKYDKSQLIGGLVVTGGAANMKNIEKAFENHTQFEKIRFITKAVNNIQVHTSTSDFNKNGSFNSALAIIDDKGSIDLNCCVEEEIITPADTNPHEEEVEKDIIIDQTSGSEGNNNTDNKPAAETNKQDEVRERQYKEEEEEEKPVVKKPKKPSRFKMFFTKLSQLVSEEDPNSRD